MVLCCELTGLNSPTKSQFYRPYVRARLVSSLTPGLRAHGGRKRMVWVRGFPPLRPKNVARMGHGALVFFSGEPGRGTQRAPTSPGLCRQLRQGRKAEARLVIGVPTTSIRFRSRMPTPKCSASASVLSQFSKGSVPRSTMGSKPITAVATASVETQFMPAISSPAFQYEPDLTGTRVNLPAQPVRECRV
jgi:hypothetical protein